MVKLLREKGLIKSVLVIAPLRVCYNVWPEQKNDWEEFKNLKVSVLHGKNKEEALKEDADIYVINPEGLEWLFAPEYKTEKDSKGKTYVNKKKITAIHSNRISKMDVLVVDESTKFKSYASLRFILLKHALRYFRRRYILTGTIAPNGLLDLFGQIFILDEGAALGKFITHYREKYFYPSGYGGYEWKPKVDATNQIAERIAPLVVQIDHQDHLVMPKLLPPNDLFIDLPPKLQAMYKTMEDKLVADIVAGKVVAANAAVASSKCRQICNGAIYLDDGTYEVLHDLKLQVLEDLIEELSGEPLLIAYQFEFDRVAIGERLKIPCIGRGSPAQDAAIMAAFKRGDLPAVMGHPETISLGLDGLQNSCSNICWFGVPWNLLHYLQTIDRVWRQGSRADSVSIHRILARGTVDERAVEVVEGKDATQADFLKMLGGLTKDQGK
jgi:SNF2 family DNA or RNA helicase